MIKKFFSVVIISGLAAFYSCGTSDKTEESVDVDHSTEQAVQETKLNAQNVFNSMPDRKEVLRLIEENRIEYNADLLNDPNQVDKYTLEFSKAANLGIYGSDLSVASAFDQTQESMIFLKCVNLLAGDLGVNKAFDQYMFDRMEANKQNKDSTLEIITGAFRSADEILKNNNRPATSAIILAGAWIEGLHVSCKFAETMNTESLVKSILSQKESLKNLVKMLEASNLDASSKFIFNDLNAILSSYEKCEKTDKFVFDSIKEISDKANDLRKKIIAGA